MAESRIKELKERILNEVKHEKLERTYINEKGDIIFASKWYNYKCKLQDNGTLSYKVGGTGNKKLLLLVLSGLIVWIPFLFVFYIGITEAPVLKDLKRQVAAIV
jgi:hypothetical protein